MQVNQGTPTEARVHSTALEPLRVPVARLSPALKLGEATLTFVAVVQGASGANIVKALKRESRQSIANAMFYELMNGYSVVFSAVFLSSKVGKAGDRASSWQQVRSYAELLEVQGSIAFARGAKSNSNLEERKVGIVC